MRGYVVYSEDSTRVEAIREARHYSSLGEFVITEVFDNTATAVLIPPAEENVDYEFDVEVGDAVILK